MTISVVADVTAVPTLGSFFDLIIEGSFACEAWPKSKRNILYARVHSGYADPKASEEGERPQVVVNQDSARQAFFGMGAAIRDRGFPVIMDQPEVRKWILIVDDDSSVRTMLARVLSEEGYGVLTAANGGDAVGLAETLSVDLILLDLNMPGANGWKTLEELNAKRIAPSVIIITAMPNQQGAARAAGVETVLEKPLDFPRLLHTVGEMLAKPAKLRQSA